MREELYENSKEYLNRWVISYADFVTILLALFIVMWSFSGGFDSIKNVDKVIIKQDFIIENLTKEKEKYGTISLRDFYLRRILRIYPVYYLVLLISFFFYEQMPSIGTISFNIALLPNIGRLFDGRWATSPQIWSIGVENMFYVFFPLILLLVSKKRILLLLAIMTSFFAILPHIIDYINVRTIRDDALSLFNNRFFFENKFDSLFIGCIIGFAFADNHMILKIFYNKCLYFSRVMNTFVKSFS